MKDKYTLIYDELEIIEDKIKYILENKEDFDYIDDFSEENLFKIVSEDYDEFNFCWDNFKEVLTEYLKEIDKHNRQVFKIKGVHMGWRNLEGHKQLRARDSEELLKGILPNTSEFSLYVRKTKTEIIIKCSHHDSPMGEFYHIKALNRDELKEFEEDEGYY